jgi:hypothetical protein
MSAVPKSVPSSVPSAVPSASNSVPVNKQAQRGPYQPMTGSAVVPVVPRSDAPDPEMAQQPGYGTIGKTGATLQSGATGAPSVPAQPTALWKPGPIDVHYQDQNQGGKNPYKVNRPKAKGLFTWVQNYANHIGLGSQNTDNAGWRQNGAQQRTSVMRVTPPAHGDGYAPQSYVPNQLPQQPNTYRFNPVIGNNDPGTLNSSTFGAGQTAGGIGGNQYTPSPGPPETNSTAQNASQDAGMPTWG